MRRLSNRRAARAAFVFAALAFAPGIAFAQPNVLSGNYDNQRTNANLQETILNASNVNTANFGKLGTFPVDGQIYAQPLYVAGLSIPSQGPRNVVFVVTMHNTVYAIDADAPQSTGPLWQVNLGTSVPSSVLSFHDAVPEVGILSTPVIDLERQVIYVCAETLESNVPVFRLHALSLTDGREILNGPVVIAATVPGTTDGSQDGVLPFLPFWQLQRPGLALANDTVYLAFGSHADDGLFHGWMIGYDAANVQHQVSVYNSSPNAWGAAIWQTGRAPAIDENGNLYVVTGNGEFDGESSLGESMLKLSPTLSLVDYFTPDIWMEMRDGDGDFSSGVVLIPDTKLAVGGAKSGNVYVVQRDDMGHLAPGTSSRVQMGDYGIFDIALWNSSNGPIVYMHEPFGALEAFAIVDGKIAATPQSQTSNIYSTWSAGIAISSDGVAGSGAIVWETTGDIQKNQVPGTLHAFDATDLTNELWNSDQMPSDSLGRFAKFVAPTVVNGRVYVPTFSNSLAIYGQLPGGLPVNNPISIGGVVNGASFAGDSVSPGELVAIFGSNLGPAQLSNTQLDASGRVTTSLSDTQVFFDGIAAPLIYSSANQVGAVVPFGVTGPQTQIAIQYQGQLSSPITMPVVAASPALFSYDGTGGGSGAIINQDGQVNSSDVRAAPGSIVSLYATGGGQMTPAPDDGQVPLLPPFAQPVLKVQVLIDDQPADVLYAGSAPGIVQGVLQINARIPATAMSGEVRIVVKVGQFSSPSTVTVWVQ